MLSIIAWLSINARDGIGLSVTGVNKSRWDRQDVEQFHLYNFCEKRIMEH